MGFLACHGLVAARRRGYSRQALDAKRGQPYEGLEMGQTVCPGTEGREVRLRPQVFLEVGWEPNEAAALPEYSAWLGRL